MKDVWEEAVKSEGRLKWQPYELVLDRFRPKKWTVDGMLADGLICFGGYPGVGKTTVLQHLGLMIAGLIKDPKIPIKRRRRIIHITEDVGQVEAGLVAYCKKFKLDIEEVRYWYIPMQAERYEAEEWRNYEETAREYTVYMKHQKTGEDVAIPPLTILDTQTANLQLFNENDNSEVSKCISCLKVNSEKYGLPIWLVGHIAKQLERKAVMTFRGASAFEGDCNAVVFLVEETGHRYILLGKHRYQAKIKQLEYTVEYVSDYAEDELGFDEECGAAIAQIQIISEEQKIENTLEGKKQEADEVIRVAVRIVERNLEQEYQMKGGVWCSANAGKTSREVMLALERNGHLGYQKITGENLPKVEGYKMGSKAQELFEEVKKGWRKCEENGTVLYWFKEYYRDYRAG